MTVINTYTCTYKIYSAFHAYDYIHPYGPDSEHTFCSFRRTAFGDTIAFFFGTSNNDRSEQDRPVKWHPTPALIPWLLGMAKSKASQRSAYISMVAQRNLRLKGIMFEDVFLVAHNHGQFFRSGT